MSRSFRVSSCVKTQPSVLVDIWHGSFMGTVSLANFRCRFSSRGQGTSSQCNLQKIWVIWRPVWAIANLNYQMGKVACLLLSSLVVAWLPQMWIKRQKNSESRVQCWVHWKSNFSLCKWLNLRQKMPKVLPKGAKLWRLWWRVWRLCETKRGEQSSQGHRDVGYRSCS